jgi:hypothetical protein
MQTRPLIDFKGDFTEEGFGRLSSSLERIKKGSNIVLITPQARRAGPDKILQAWSKEFLANTSELNEDLLELENSNKIKFGPRSIAKPWDEIREQAKDSFDIPSTTCEHLKTSPPLSHDIGTLRPISLNNSAKLTKANTQAGAPTLRKKGKVREYTLENWASLYDDNLPMIPAIRTQEQQKTRLVNIVDYATIMQENRFFTPLFNLLEREFCFSAFRGPEAVNSAMTKLIHEASSTGHLCVSGDIEKFDDSVGVDLQRAAFIEISQYFQPQYRNEITELFYRFNMSSLVTPDGVWTGSHGIPSGSNLTGLVGSIVNRQVSQHPPELSQFMGDDFALVAKTESEVFDKYSSCNLILNKSKTIIKPYSFVYLQRLHHLDYMVDGECVGIYPTFRALNRLCYPERFSDFNDYDLSGRDYFAIRSLSILENCKYHPLFEKFVKFWMKYEKYKVPSNSSVLSYVKMIEERIGSLGTVNQYGDKVEGIRAFKSYQLVRSLS